MKLIPVVLSGGSGTRLWPVSRANHPKQFSKLLEETLQSLTLKRLSQYGPSVVVTSTRLKVLTQKEILENNFQIEKVIYEPQGKNTAAAVAIACQYLALKKLEASVVGVFSSDALILKEDVFHQVIEVAAREASLGQVVTLGIRPDHIETGFGYIQVSKNCKLNEASSVLKFHEKPNYQTAESFVQSGDYFWNAGIFIFQVQRMIQHFKKHQPKLWDLVETLKLDLSNLTDIYSEVQSLALDVAIIEKLESSELKCVPCDIGWSDLGSWDVLDHYKSDLKAEPIEVDSNNNSIFSAENKIYGLVGMQDMILVDTSDAVLVCKKGDSQKIKELVDKVKAQRPRVVEDHRFEVRPWGQFEVLKNENHFKSKIIKVDAGQKISYQSHQFRSEHWVLVKGNATVTINDEEIDLVQGQHIFIPQGAKHRIHNKSNSGVEIIEVQLGSYFGEDDIIRYQDDYGR